MTRLAMIVKTTVQPGQRDAVRDLFTRHLGARALANDAQEILIWCDDDANPDVFYLFEIYRDRAAFQANAQAAAQEGWFQAYLQQAQPLLAGQPEVIMASPQWAKGVAL